jgi:hypothetical protein
MDRHRPTPTIFALLMFLCVLSGCQIEFTFEPAEFPAFLQALRVLESE